MAASLPEPEAAVQPTPPGASEKSDAPVSPASGRLLVAIAATLWSSSGFFAKAPIFADWPLELRGTLLAFWRALFAGVLILPAVRRPRWSWRLVPMALAFAAMNVLYLKSMTLTTAANAIWLQSTAPWWVFLFGAVVLRQKVDRADIVPLLFGVLGVGVILAFELPGASRLGIVLGLASAFGYAAVVMFLRALREEDAAFLVAVNHLVTAACVAPYIIAHQVWPSAWQLAVLAAFGFFQMALPYMLFSKGLRSITGQEATAIGLLEPILLPLWVLLAWGERPAIWTLAGATLILIGLLWRYRPAARRTPLEPSQNLP